MKNMPKSAEQPEPEIEIPKTEQFVEHFVEGVPEARGALRGKQSQ